MAESQYGISSTPFDNTEYKKKMNKRARDRGLLTVPFPEVEEANNNPLFNQTVDTIVQETLSDIVSVLDVDFKLAQALVTQSLQRIWNKSIQK